MVTTMARTEIKVGRYIIDFIPVVFLIRTAILCNQFNSSINHSEDAMKLVSDLNRQRTAAEMRAHKAEQSLAANASKNAPGVVIIAPDSNAVQSIQPNRDMKVERQEVVF